jgi:hypothetical protein
MQSKSGGKNQFWFHAAACLRSTAVKGQAQHDTVHRLTWKAPNEAWQARCVSKNSLSAHLFRQVSALNPY